MKEDMRTSWREAAMECKKTYGSYVCWKSEHFLCPECGEPVYLEDYPDHDWKACPVCEYKFFEDGDE